jgi:hypothetical protein
MGADGALPVRKEERVERLALTEKKGKENISNVWHINCDSNAWIFMILLVTLLCL